MYYKKAIKAFLFAVGFLSIVNASEVEKKPNVNVMVWYGYLDDPKITRIVEKKCNITMSHDTYYSNDEFLNRFNKNKKNYDLIIFSDTVFNTIEDYVNKSKGSNISNISNNFDTRIREHYKSEHLPNNVSYFMHSLTGFWYNPKNINIKDGESAKEIFKNAKDNIIILLDDPVEIWNLVNMVHTGKVADSNNFDSSVQLNYGNIKSITQDSTVFISNNNNRIYADPKFAFGFLWSGDVINYMNQIGKDFKFYVSPDLSYISTDMLATLNNNNVTKCAANALLSKPVLDIIQKETQFFSPYGDYGKVSNKQYKQLYKNSLKNLDKLPWLPRVTKSQYHKLERQWSEAQIKINDMQRENA